MTTPEERSKFTRYLAACEDDIERVANAVDGLKSDEHRHPVYGAR